MISCFETKLDDFFVFITSIFMNLMFLMYQKEEEKLRQTNRPSKPRRTGTAAQRTREAANNYREEEGSDEEGVISLAAIKNKYKSGANAKSEYITCKIVVHFSRDFSAYVEAQYHCNSDFTDIGLSNNKLVIAVKL